MIVDIHTHILPGVDDGAKDVNDAMEMLSIAEKDGTTDIFLTPHFSHHNTKWQETINNQFLQFKKKATTEFPDLNLYLGAEIFYKGSETDSFFNSKRIPTMNGSRYVLIEFSDEETESEALKAIRVARDNGYIPIIAHVERYPKLYKSLSGFKRLDVFLQQNAYSVTGKRKEKRLTKHIDLIGSDAHDPIKSPPILSGAIKELSKKQSNEQMLNIMGNNPAFVINDQMKR